MRKANLVIDAHTVMTVGQMLLLGTNLMPPLVENYFVPCRLLLCATLSGTMLINVLSRRVTGWTVLGEPIKRGHIPLLCGRWALLDNASLIRPLRPRATRELV
jgi:hypothetical protein